MLFGAAGFGRWLAVATIPRSTLETGEGVRRVTARAPGASAAFVNWNNPYPDLNLELRTLNGEVVANSAETEPGAAVALEPGAYRLRAFDRKGAWRGGTRKVTLVKNKTVTLAVTPEVAAEYYLWVGDQQHAQGSEREAEKAWRQAIQVSPRALKARLQLVQSLIRDLRYRDARAELKSALAIAPNDIQLTRWLKTLDNLEALR